MINISQLPLNSFIGGIGSGCRYLRGKSGTTGKEGKIGGSGRDCDRQLVLQAQGYGK
jgi:hypothetical protein